MTRSTNPRTKGARASRAGAAPYVFMAPAMLFFLGFFAVPIGYTIYLSTRRTKISGLGLGKNSRHEVSVGLANYKDSLSDSTLWSGLLRVLFYGTVVLVVMLGLALVFALALDHLLLRVRGSRTGRFARIAIFLPYAVPGVIASLLWGFLYQPKMSPLGDVAGLFGLPMPELLSGGAILPSVANVAIWGGVGFNMLVLYTALRTVPSELYDAARVDGASDWHVTLRIKLPLLYPALILTTVFSIIATLQVFTEPYTLRSLSNGISSTWSPLMKIYTDAFIDGDLYSAAATSVIIAVFALVLSFSFLRVVQKRAFGEER
jgi:multiple sugar transport system permease protein